MLNLLEGIRVVDYCSTPCEKPRVWMSSGTLQPISKSLPQIPYSNDAFIPIESWREPLPVENRLVFDDTSVGHLDKSNHIGIIHLPEFVIAPLVELGVAFTRTAKDCNLIAQHPLYQDAISKIVDFLSPLYSSQQSFAVHRVNVNPSGLPTVTFNQATHHFIGLHLDSWDNLPIQDRALSTNRVCINLGLEDRFLLFINLTLADILYLTQIDGDDSISILSSTWETREQDWNTLTSLELDPNAIRKAFLTRYSQYPVIKLRISPGEAYIAPTENMIHDGCTTGKQFFDVTLTIRGHIELPAR